MLAVMIPTYNEKDNIELLVEKIISIIKDVKIVIVDDNSPDGTGDIADKLAKKYKNNIYVLHRKERGRGTAGIAGFKKCLELNPDYIMEMDADFSHDPQIIPSFLKEIKSFDVVIGSRYVEGGKIFNRGFIRDFMSSIVNFYTSIVLGFEVKDKSGGYKCYRSEVLRNIDLDNFVSNGYSIGVETLYKIHKKNYTMKEMPITFNNRVSGKSKLSVKQIINYILMVVLIRLKA